MQAKRDLRLYKNLQISINLQNFISLIAKKNNLFRVPKALKSPLDLDLGN